MSVHTPHLGLIQPAEEEKYDIGIFNNNFEMLDHKLHQLEMGPKNYYDPGWYALDNIDYTQCQLSKESSNVELAVQCLRLTSPITVEPQRIMRLLDDALPRNGSFVLPCVLFSNADLIYDTEPGFVSIGEYIEVWKSASCVRDDLFCVGFHTSYATLY